MSKPKLYLKRLAYSAGTIGVIIAGAAAFSAFESHIINVTARIENALLVNEEAIDFGTVFPQEYLTSDVSVALSESFRGEDRVDDIRYVIKQKPKVKSPDCVLAVNTPSTLGGLISVAQAQAAPCDPHENPTPGDPYANIIVGAFDGPAWQYCEENLPVNAPYDLDEEDLDDEYWHYCYLPLANYLSKHEITPDLTPGPDDNDTSIDAFHQAYEWVGGVLPSSLDPEFIAGGYLAKSDQDLRDRWTIDLMVPCFVRQCAQEADDPLNLVNDQTPGFYVPTEFRLPTILEHLVFGTDLWIEVTGVSESGVVRPAVGADLAAYVQPEGQACNVNVTDIVGDGEIQVGVTAATSGQTVCVGPGTYTESVVIDEDITLAGDGATATSVINGDVTIAADGATLEGFEINGNVDSDFHGVTVQFNKVTSATGSAIGFGGSVGTGSTITNNVVSNPGNRGIYLDQNGTIAFAVTYNTVNARKNGFGSLSSGTVQNNVFSGYDVVNGVGFEVVNDVGDVVVISINNFNEAGTTGLAVENDGALTFDAPDNWWGTVSAVGHHDAEVTASSPEAAPYPEN